MLSSSDCSKFTSFFLSASRLSLCNHSTPANFITAVVEMFRAELLVANEYVFTADEPGKHLYIIHIGRVEIITPEGIVVGKLSDGAYFGEIAILVDVRRTSSVRT